jgi:hypothetical protein
MERAAAVGENWIFTTLQEVIAVVRDKWVRCKVYGEFKKTHRSGGLPLAENDKSAPISFGFLSY